MSGSRRRSISIIPPVKIVSSDEAPVALALCFSAFAAGAMVRLVGALVGESVAMVGGVT